MAKQCLPAQDRRIDSCHARSARKGKSGGYSNWPPGSAVRSRGLCPGRRTPADDGARRLRRSWLVLFFYPRDFTFVCPTELQAFAELEATFAAEEAALVAASTDSFWSHKAWFESHPMLGAVRYPVLADSAQRVASAYDVLLEDGSALRATFIVDPAGVVRHSTISDQSVGRSPDETLRVLQALRTGALCPVGWRKGQPTLQAA